MNKKDIISYLYQPAGTNLTIWFIEKPSKVFEGMWTWQDTSVEVQDDDGTIINLMGIDNIISEDTLCTWYAEAKGDN